MKFFDSEETLQTALDAFLEECGARLGLVSLEVPLISNQPVWSNIALIRQYHENMPWQAAKTLAVALLARFGMGDIADKRSYQLKREELFCAMLIRAAMVRNAVVVLDRPLGLLSEPPGKQFFRNAFEEVDDLIAEIHIFDYSWEKERYGKTDASEN